MAKFGFYGVYGRNGGGVYTDWDKLQCSLPYIPSNKYKKFSSRRDAVQFIIYGLVKVYRVCEENEINIGLIYSNTNFYITEQQLISYNVNRLIEAPFRIIV